MVVFACISAVLPPAIVVGPDGALAEGVARLYADAVDTALAHGAVRDVHAEGLAAALDAEALVAGHAARAAWGIHARFLLWIAHHSSATILVRCTLRRACTGLVLAGVGLHALTRHIIAGHIANRDHTEALVADLAKGAVVIQVTDRIGAVVGIRALLIHTGHPLLAVAVRSVGEYCSAYSI